MSKYKVILEETVVSEFNIEARNKNEAFGIACKKYLNGEIVIEPGEVQSKKIAVIETCNDQMKFIEF